MIRLYHVYLWNSMLLGKYTMLLTHLKKLKTEIGKADKDVNL